nr:PD-(D/E)XK nuclease-like domain-containing protein [Kineosporia babensis]
MSSSTARRILAPGGPARVQWERKHPVFKDAYDLGTVTHLHVLGKGAEVVEVEAANWQTKDAKAQRDDARAEGRTPILTKDLLKAKAMARAVLSNKQVRALGLFKEGNGLPERSIFWEDDESGITCRAMLDWLGEIPVDLKTTNDASPEAVSKAVYSYGYDQQQDWYQAAVRGVGIDENPPFVFVFVETEAPHFVSVVELDDAFLDRGARRNRAGIERWVQCRESGIWPGYSEDIQTISPPRWARYEGEEL